MQPPKLVIREMGTQPAWMDERKGEVVRGPIVPVVKDCLGWKWQAGVRELKLAFNSKTGTHFDDWVFHLLGWGDTPDKAERMALQHPLMHPTMSA